MGKTEKMKKRGEKQDRGMYGGFYSITTSYFTNTCAKAHLISSVTFCFQTFERLNIIFSNYGASINGGLYD